jgi:hypothetical protein
LRGAQANGFGKKAPMNDLGDKITAAQKLRARRRKRLERKESDEDKIRAEIHEVNRELDRLRERRENNREEGDEDKAERWADEIEDLEDVKDDLLEELDQKKERTAESEKLLDEAQDRVRGLRKKREARRKSREGKGDLSPYFSLAEFNCRDGTPCPDYMRPHLAALCRDQLEPARAAHGPIRITSGYRHARYNASIGGASQSYHVYELRREKPAADHTAQNAAPSTLQRWYDSKPNPPDGMGYYAGFTHIDERGYRSRWHGAG